MYKPVFLITNKILKNIGVVEACREIILHSPLLPYYERQFRQDALVRTVHYGTHIEGNALNLTQTEKVLAGDDVVARDRDIQEVINYRKVLEYISELGSKNQELRITEDQIQAIHKLTVDQILAKEKSGAYRDTQVVVKSSATGEVSFKPPAAGDVGKLLIELLGFINVADDDFHPVLKSGAVHYEFVRIHPFVDGNGRVARALSTLILFLEGYDIRKFFSLEEYFDSDADEYYKALQSVSRRDGDITEWLEYFTKGLAIELTKIKEKVERISIDANLREKLGGHALMLTDRQLKIIEYIQKTGYLQNQAFGEMFPMVSEDTILNELKPLIDAGIIKKHGVTKGARYIMNK